MGILTAMALGFYLCPYLCLSVVEILFASGHFVNWK